MSQPDRIALRVLQQRATPPDGMTTVQVDLAAFVESIAEVGRDPALLLLTIRALRQRSGATLRFDDLVWVMGARSRRIRAWLDRLAAEGKLVYDVPDGVIEIELPEPMPPTWADVQPPHVPLRFELPTHWFIHVLPRLGRATFTTYLYLLRRDGMTAPATMDFAVCARDTLLPTTLHARWHLWRLRRHGLVVLDRKAETLVVMDPPPLTPKARRWLRQLRTTGLTPHRLALAVALAVALVVVVLVAVMVLVRTASGV